MDKDIEIITVREALTRVYLEGLIPESDYQADSLVAWKGYPVPFACGHNGKRGFGPLDESKENNSKGKGRRYQEQCRISQHFCSGAVLFNWQLVAASKKHYLNGSVSVSIDHPPDCKIDTVLKLCFSA